MVGSGDAENEDPGVPSVSGAARGVDNPVLGLKPPPVADSPVADSDMPGLAGPVVGRPVCGLIGGGKAVPGAIGITPVSVVIVAAPGVLVIGRPVVGSMGELGDSPGVTVGTLGTPVSASTLDEMPGGVPAGDAAGLVSCAHATIGMVSRALTVTVLQSHAFITHLRGA